MKMQAGHDTVSLPERIEESTGELHIVDAYLIDVAHVAKSVLDEQLVKSVDVRTRGMPRMWALHRAEEYDFLVLWPPPDQDYDATFRYCPARRQI